MSWIPPQTLSLVYEGWLIVHVRTSDLAHVLATESVGRRQVCADDGLVVTITNQDDIDNLNGCIESAKEVIVEPSVCPP